MTEFMTWREHDYPARQLPSFAIAVVGAPETVEYLSIQFGPLTTEERRRLSRRLIELLLPLGWSAQLLLQGRAEPAAVGHDAAESFLEEVGGDLWWVGDVALYFSNGTSAALLSPEVDGDMLDVVVWGRGASKVVDNLLEEACSTGGSGSANYP
jgi:hypothetical protein